MRKRELNSRIAIGEKQSSFARRTAEGGCPHTMQVPIQLLAELYTPGFDSAAAGGAATGGGAADTGTGGCCTATGAACRA
jgi:hypothetical protein